MPRAGHRRQARDRARAAGRHGTSPRGYASAAAPRAEPPRHSPPAREAIIEPLTPKQRAHLRSLAHHLKPVHHIGKEGITDAVVRAVEDAFNTRELLKVKVQEAAPMSAAATGEALAARVEGSHQVQTIGRTVVLFRPHPKKPEIRLPQP